MNKVNDSKRNKTPNQTKIPSALSVKDNLCFQTSAGFPTWADLDVWTDASFVGILGDADISRAERRLNRFEEHACLSYAFSLFELIQHSWKCFVSFNIKQILFSCLALQSLWHMLVICVQNGQNQWPILLSNWCSSFLLRS